MNDFQYNVLAFFVTMVLFLSVGIKLIMGG